MKMCESCFFPADFKFRDPAVPLTEDQKLNRKQVAEQVRKYDPDKQEFNMDWWDGRIPYDVWYAGDYCETAKCAAGWSLHYAGIDVIDLLQDATASARIGLVISEAAVETLGLTDEEFHNKDYMRPLFHDTEENVVIRMRKLTEE